VATGKGSQQGPGNPGRSFGTLPVFPRRLGSDGTTFQVIGPSTKGFGYAKDAKRVYFAASPIEGADPATFEIEKSDPDRAKDKNGAYQYGQPAKK